MKSIISGKTLKQKSKSTKKKDKHLSISATTPRFPNLSSVVGGEHSPARKATTTLLDSSTTQEDCIPFTVRDKIIVSGDTVEYYRYEKPVFARSGNRRRKSKKKKVDYDAFRRFERWASPPVRRFRASSLNRIRRLILTNFIGDMRFFTLTFNNDNPFPLDDFDRCNYEFKKFIQRLRTHSEKFIYIAVPEFQKRGAIHYHIVIDIPFIKHKKLEKIWGKGFVFVQLLKNSQGIAGYITKYLKKNAQDPRFYGKKTYFTSRGLKQPLTLYGKEALKKLQNLPNRELTYISNYNSFMNGKVDYSQYDVNPEKETS